MAGVVIFSPSRFSLYTLTITELLIREGIEVRTMVVRRMINPQRLRQEYKQYPLRFVSKVIDKLFLREKAYASELAETIVAFRNSQGFIDGNVDKLCRSHNIPVIYCKSLNDDKVVRRLKKQQPDLVIFTGGGLVRREVLSCAGHGVLNCHMGILPRYRGMDVVEWAILEDNLDQVGITIHFMNEGVDTGPILKIIRIPLRKSETISRLRNRFEPIMCVEMVKTAMDYLNGDIQPQPQMPADGKQYFVMHARLLDIVRSKAIKVAN